MSLVMRIILLLVFSGLAVTAQQSDLAVIERHGADATLTVDTFRPLDAIATRLEEEFGIVVSAEDPFYMFSGDTMDISLEVSRVRAGTLVPRRRKLEVHFPLNSHGSPRDVRELLNNVIDTANAQLPFAYRLDVDGAAFFLVPTRTRDAQGRSIDVTPLLDRKVTIPPGTRSIAENAQLMADALSSQTGLRVSCCQSFVAGYPWGMEKISFAAGSEPARNVLKRLGLNRWHVRCDMRFCAIDLR
jgi:hypothetical protein